MSPIAAGTVPTIVVEVLRHLAELAWKNREDLRKTGQKIKEFTDERSAARKNAAGTLDGKVKLLEDGLLRHDDLLAEVNNQITTTQEGLEAAAKELDAASKQLAAAIEDQAKVVDQRLAMSDRKVRLATYSALVSVGVAVVALVVAIVK
jgi:uncharacterized protein (DUF3084 family)